MRLLIIGHTAHYIRKGQIVGWGPTVTEVDWMARLFDQVTHLACLHPGHGPESALGYQSNNVRFVGVPPTGGKSWRLRSGALGLGAVYTRTILGEIRQADLIQLRIPGPLGFFGLILTSLLTQKPRWTKYAGNWVDKKGQTPLQKLQRLWLKQGFSRGPVTVNGYWPGHPTYIFNFINPSFSIEEARWTRQAVLNKHLTTPILLVYAGQLRREKGIATVLQVLKILIESTEARLDLFGDGPDRADFEALSREMGLAGRVTFHGWVPHAKVKGFLAKAHFILLPSESEGWPKVLSEGMVNGAIPLASRVSSIPQILEACQTGYTFTQGDSNGYAQVILDFINHPDRWQKMSKAGQEAALRFTYERYLVALDDMLTTFYYHPMLNQAVLDGYRKELSL